VVFDRGFIRSEFGCNCGCGLDTIDAETLEVLVKIKRWANNAVVVTSGCRCARWNADCGGYPSSWHLRFRASDIIVIGKTPRQVADFLEERFPDKYGIGRYRTFTHIDTREGKARWGSN
jgi:hypothetical protein